MSKYTAVQNLIKLDHDMIKAYDTAVALSERADTLAMLNDFRGDHIQQTENLGAVLENFDKNVPDGPDVFRWLTQGRVVLANIIGLEYDLLAALNDNAGMLIKAYDEALALSNLDAAMQQTLQSNRDNIARHSKWLSERCAAISEKTATP